MTQPTPAEIQELNALMAQQVMGWTLRTSGCTFPCLGPSGSLYRTEGAIAERWNPTADAAQAVEVAEKFSTEFAFGDRNAFEIVQLLFEIDRWAFSVSGLKGPFIRKTGPFPIAICLAISAALAAGSVRKEGI